MDIITHINQHKLRAVIVTVDFEKCFDRIEYGSMLAAMRYFNFGEKFVSWVGIFFTNILLCTQNAGFVSELFCKTRGCNQGCNLSLFCFTICAEIMAHLIKNNPKIRGIKMSERQEVEDVISQFADDTCLFLLYNEECIQTVIDTFTHIESNTGLKVSYDKTCIYHIGSLKK